MYSQIQSNYDNSASMSDMPCNFVYITGKRTNSSVLETGLIYNVSIIHGKQS